MTETHHQDRTSPAERATGDDRVDAAVARLDELDALPPTEHAEVYEEVHQRLADSLVRREEG